MLIKHSVQRLSQFTSVAQLCPTLCYPMDCSRTVLPVHHQLPELTQIHVHWFSDAIQPSHHLSSPSPPTFNLSQHQGLFPWVSSLYQVAKVLTFNFSIFQLSDEYSGLISFAVDLFDLLEVQVTLKSLLQHHSSKSTNSSVPSFIYRPTLTSIRDYWKNHSFDQMDLCQHSNVSAF